MNSRPSSRPVLSFLLLLCGTLLCAVLVAGLVWMNRIDREQNGWYADDGGFTSYWDLEGRYTVISACTAGLCLSAGLLAFGAARKRADGTRWLLPLVGIVLLWAGIDEWFSLHNLLRDRLLLPWLGAPSPAELPAVALDPVMLVYVVLAVGWGLYGLKAPGWSVWPRLPLVLATVCMAGVYLLDGPAGVWLHFDARAIVAEEILQLLAAAGYTGTMGLLWVNRGGRCRETAPA